MKILQWVYTVYSILIFIILMFLFGLFITLSLLLGPKSVKISFFFIRIWAKIWSWLSGIRYEIHGIEHVKPNQPYIYIFNHRSFIDAPVIPIAIPQEIRVIGKKELSMVPFFGLVVARFAIWVDRKDAASRKRSIEKLLKTLKTNISIVVAPEGTRNNTNKTLLPFQRGAFRVSVDTGIPILPMAILGADRIMKKGSILLKPGKVKVYFSSPIEPDNFQKEGGYQGLSEKCFNRLEAMILTHE
jgi:1-acyl-sn-glycerol-3-phosphate acyltransferase